MARTRNLFWGMTYFRYFRSPQGGSLGMGSVSRGKSRGDTSKKFTDSRR